jgi:hypothetical protein
LNWTIGAGAVSHDVYFGTTGPANFQGNQAETTFAPGTLDYNRIYYWRIDEVNEVGTTIGAVWSFETQSPPRTASNPNPPDGSPGIRPDPVLSWEAGFGSLSHDVYFGTTSPGTFQKNQEATTFVPGNLEHYRTYYWRIDEVNDVGTTTGAVWTFTTEGIGPR